MTETVYDLRHPVDVVRETIVGDTPIVSRCGTGGGNVPFVMSMPEYRVEDVAPTLLSRMGTGGNQVPVVVDGPCALHENQRGEVRLYETCPALSTPGGKPGQGNPVVLDDQGGEVMAVRTDGMVGTLRANAKHHEPIVLEQTAYRFSSKESNVMNSKNPHTGIKQTAASPTLDVTCANPSCDQGGIGIVSGRRLRRLTPRECERLQGFPDDWTLISYRGKPPEACPDSPRYKAVGNSWAVPVVRWLGLRIQKNLEGKL